MKRHIQLIISIFVLTNIIYSQDIINETGKDGKFIVRDAEQHQALVIEDGNVGISGTLSIDSLAQGTVEDRQVVWSTEDKQFKALYNLIPRSTINASTMAADSWTENSGDVYRATGNVGIGIATPIYPLTVYRSGANASVVTQRDGGAINYINATATHGTFGTVNNFVTRISQNAQIKIFLDKDNNGLYFGSNGNITAAGDDDIDMAIDSNGNVGIGTTNPLSPLHVNSNREYAPVARFINTENTDSGWGIWAKCDNGGPNGTGGKFEGGRVGIEGIVTPSSPGPEHYGYKGVIAKVDPNIAYSGLHSNYGVYSEAYKGLYNYGTYGYANGGVGTEANYGLYGYAAGTGNNYGIYAYAAGGTSNYAGYFSGNVYVLGTLAKSAGSFKIDHPLDPGNKYLSHSFVESPDMMNIYNGNVITDANGEAVVEMPDYFEPLNKDFRYQLTCVGGWAPVYIAEKISGNRFKIAGGESRMEVSWQVTGIRQDAFAEANRIKVEEDKLAHEQGKYIHPELFGKPVTMGINYHEKEAIEMKKMEEQNRIQ